jgi:thiamine biosynthesis lipoprotein
MGTTWAVKVVPSAVAVEREELAARVAARLERLEQQFSTYRPDSEVMRFNRSTSIEWQPVSVEIAEVAAGSRRVSERTGGAFDATVAPLVWLWGFGSQRRSDRLPGEVEIAEARARVGWARLELRAEPPALRKTHADLAVDFSSMAKGYAADAVAALLCDAGAPNHFVRVGGDIRTGGRGASGGGWRAGIEQPTGEAHGMACVVELSGQALSTSGDYRNAFVVEGRRYGHIIDPRTGSPVSGVLAAVSVVRPTCAESSAWATALFVLGAEEGWRVAEREHLACVFFVRKDAAIEQRATEEFRRLVR